MTEVRAVDVRRGLADVLNRVAYGQERITLTRNGKRVAAVVSLADLAQLEAKAPARRAGK